MTPEQFEHYKKNKAEVLKIEEEIIQNLRDAGKMSSRENVDLIEIRGNNIYIQTNTYRNSEYSEYEYFYPFEVLSSAETILEYDEEKARIKLLEDIERKMKFEEAKLKAEQEDKLKQIENEKKLYEELKKKYGDNV